MTNRYFLDRTFNINPKTARALLARTGWAMTLALALTAMLAPRTQAQTYSVLYSFTNAGDGAYPYGGVTVDSTGNLYGTTYQGGKVKDCGLFAGCGVVYKLDPSGKLTVLHSFVGNSDGRQPYFGNLFRDSAGNIFSTTVYGGIKNNIGVGTAFEITNTGHESILHQFLGGADDAQQPNQGLIHDADGYFYGTSVAGGSAEYGTVYRMSKSGKIKILHTFTGLDGDGANPAASVTVGKDGVIYGTTENGGSPTAPCPSSYIAAAGCGTVFELLPPPAPGDAWAEKVLYAFSNQNGDGAYPTSALALDPAGVLFGTTSAGGAAGFGTVFAIKP